MTRHLRKLESILRLAPSRITGDYRLSIRRCLNVRDKRGSVSIDTLRGVTHGCNVTLSMLVFNRRPGVDSCFLAHYNSKISMRQAGTCGCRSLTSNFHKHGTSPFVIAMRPGPRGAPVRFGSRRKRRFGLIVRKEVLLGVGKGRLVLGPNSDLCFSSSVPRNVVTLSSGAIGFLTMVLWWVRVGGATLSLATAVSGF